jgi:hypothetical protein
MNNQSAKLTLFVGDTCNFLAISAKKYSADAFLLDHSNYKLFFDTQITKDVTIYTSLGDLPKDLQIFINLCKLADQIFYCPPNTWSDNSVLNDSDPSSSIQGFTEHLLQIVSLHTPVYGLEIPLLQEPVPLVDNRKSISPQLWVAGCSISHGTGVLPNQRYGKLLSDNLDLECSFLTRPGAAIDWASDQIIRSDIKCGDTVVFGITTVQRLTYIDNKKLVVGVNHSTYNSNPSVEKILPIHNLLTENTFYQHVLSIERVINFCNKVGAKLLLVGILTNLNPNMLRFLKTKKNFCQIPYALNANNLLQFTDLGSDNSHPGPLQHQLYADTILKHLTSQ